jgi:hypothetical protein
LFNHFFRKFIPKKEVFKFTKPICPCSPSNLYRHILHATILWIHYSKPWGFGFRARGLQDTCHQRLIFSNLLEDKDRRLKIKLTLSMILRVNLRLGGYSMWSASLIAPHIKEDLTNYSGHEHLIASMQPRKYSEDTFRTNFGRTRRCLQKYPDACSTRLQRARGACQTRAHGTVHVAYLSQDTGWDMAHALHLL